ncbi:MAG: ABC transporter substrate-binding protein, partial [Alphaproteobacteria bacterium]
RNKLVDARTDGGLEPDLATDWDVSGDGKSWIFKLRKGVEFHNGKTLDAQDVIDSMNIHRGEDSTSGGKSMMAVVSDIKADGDNVVFELSEPVADF